MLRLIPLEFDYVAHAPVHLAAGKATNIVRGALGLALRTQGCPPSCADSKACSRHCLYQQLFEGETAAPRPSGYQEPPRPYVLRSPDWAERTIAPGDHLITSIHLFDRRPEILNALLRAYINLGNSGLGPGRPRLTLVEIRQPGAPVLWRAAETLVEPAVTTLGLAPDQNAPRRIAAKFLTPTEIKVRGEVTRDAEFAPLFARLHERLSFLIKHYSETSVVPESALDAAKAIVTVRQSLRDAASVQRYSTRTGQTHPLAGFVGEAVYEGDFTRLWPWLKASEWTGVGRQTVWGKGAIVWEPR